MNPGWQFMCAFIHSALWQPCFGPSLLRELAASYFQFGCGSLIAMRLLEGRCDEARIASGLDAFGCKAIATHSPQRQRGRAWMAGMGCS
jgi:hypothetical protein